MSTSFSEERLRDKLNRLTPTMQSIQTVSHWVMFHRKYSNRIVDTWFNALMEAPPERKLTLVYLANEVVQSTRKTSPDFERSFESVMSDACRHIVDEVPDPKTKTSLLHTVRVWKERGVFSPATVSSILAFLDPSSAGSSSATEMPGASVAAAAGKGPSIDDVISGFFEGDQNFARDILGLLTEANKKQKNLAACIAEVQKYNPQLFTGELLVNIQDKALLTNIAYDFEDAIKAQEALAAAQSELLAAKTVLSDFLTAYSAQVQNDIAKVREENTATRNILDYSRPKLQDQMSVLYHSLPDPPATTATIQQSNPEPPDAKRARTGVEQ